MAKDIPAADLAAVRRPIETARGLPNGHYTDPALWEAERTALLTSTWAALDVASAVPQPGDAKPLTFLGIPLLLMRGRDGLVRVFQNVCRHRGMILVAEARRIEGAIRCPYHSWCYAHDGRLVATPHVGGPGQNRHPQMDPDTLGLIEVPSHVWFDTVFINLDGTADPFETVHHTLLARWPDVTPHLHHGGAVGSFKLEVRANWKLAVENYCESYHLPWVHPGLNSYSRLEDHYNISQPQAFSGQGTLKYGRLQGADGAMFPDFPNLDARFDDGAEYVALYPNVLLGLQRDHAFVIVLEPVAQDRTREHIHLYYATPSPDEALAQRNAAQWKEVFEEDIFVVEGMQAGRRAPAYDGGRFSPAMDGPTHCFHDWVAGRLGA